MMVFDDRRQALLRALSGGVLGLLGCLLLGWLSQPGSLFVGSLGFDFTFCYNHNVPETLGALLGFLLWFLFGAEVGIATLPFADEGKSLLLRSLCHFGLMGLTLWAWVLLNFGDQPLPGLALTWLLSYTLIYILVWLGRWVGWYAEVAQIRERLGLSPGPSPLKWRETLPHLGYAALLCLVVPLVLRLYDAVDVPVLTGLLYSFLLLPIGSFSAGVSLGKRQGLCPLYPAGCALFSLPVGLLLFSSPLPLCLWAGLCALLGNLMGCNLRRRTAAHD